MAKLVYLFAFVACVQVATALNCYSCDANTCQMEQDKWIKIPDCGKAALQNNIGACLKQTYTDRNTKKEVTIRKCVVADKAADGKPTFKCNDNDGVSTVCEVCNSDYCNSAPSVNLSFVSLLGVVAAFLIPRYM